MINAYMKFPKKDDWYSILLLEVFEAWYRQWCDEIAHKTSQVCDRDIKECAI